MEPQAFSSIDLAWATLRYAEVEHRPDGARPLRLGSCDFDFDVTRDVLQAEEPAHLDVVTEALMDVFAGATSTQLRVVVHPPDAYSFVTVVPAELSASDRAQRFQQEAALLAGTEPAGALHITSSAVHADTHLDVEPMQVLAVPDAVHARIERALEGLPQTEVQWMLSTQAAARTMAQNEEASAGLEAPFMLAVGVYPEHVEFALLRNGGWYYSHYVEAEELVDAAYFATALLDQLDIPRSGVARIGWYGLEVDESTFGPFETVFEVTPEPIDPFGVLGIDREVMQRDFGIGAYVPCIGAVL